MDLILHNSLTRKRETFVPRDPRRVTMYLCGPTVYNYAHIGNARPPVVFGVLVRLLRRRYPTVVYARNITDIDDKINASAADEGVPISVIAERYAAADRADRIALGADVPDIEPRATATIAEIIAMNERLIASGHAYAAEGHVLFAVESFPEYGRLSGRSTEEMIAGARVEVAPYKRYPGDFVLWKPSIPELPGWDSPWGRGRPGWHIECSAMIERHLGETIDIHAGGVDLQFPHHENEIAQSTCAHEGAPLARYWLHNGFVTVDGAKMSKSLRNVLLIDELRKRFPAEALRYFLLKAHYRQPLDWSEGTITQVIRTLDGLYGTLRELESLPVSATDTPPESVEAALCDDLNTPRALAALAELGSEARRRATPETKADLLSAGRSLGLLGLVPAQWFAQRQAEAGIDSAAVEALLAQRQEAKRARNFAEADAIRARLSGLGVAIEDTPQGTRWRVAER